MTRSRWRHYYRFHVDHDDSKACIVATWNRSVALSWLLTKSGDVNLDDAVNDDDVIAIIKSWGTCEFFDACPPDQSADGTVNLDDLLLVIKNLE